MSQIVSVSPHCHGKITTQSIMRDVLIALAPALVAGVINFGWRGRALSAQFPGAFARTKSPQTVTQRSGHSLERKKEPANMELSSLRRKWNAAGFF